MAVYLYCVLPADAPDPAVSGLDAAPVRALRASGLTAWLGDVPSTPRPELDRIRDHDRVIRSAMAAGITPVPIRFGQVLADDEAVRAHLAQRDYARELAHVADAVEFAIRVIDPEAVAEEAGARAKPPDAPSVAAGTGAVAADGAAYMRLLAERMHHSEGRRARALDAANGLDRALAQWVRDRRIEPSERPAGAAVAHLVQASAAHAYEARAKELSDDYRPLRLVVTGPWPPYSFVG